MGLWAPGPGATDGDDTFTGNASPETANGGGGDDILNGNAGNDALSGGVGNDVVNGGADNDTLTWDGGSSDVLDGGDGDDAIVLDDASYTLSLVSVFGGAGADVLRLVNAQIKAGSILSGVETGVLAGGVGVTNGFLNSLNILYVINGSLSVANLRGGTLDLSTLNAPSNFTYAGETYSNTFLYLFGSGGDDVITAPQGLGSRTQIIAGEGADQLTGGSGADHLDGSAGDDVVYGGGGDDFVYLSGGSDTAFGGAGNDTFDRQFAGEVGIVTVDGGSGIDTFVFNGWDMAPGTTIANVEVGVFASGVAQVEASWFEDFTTFHAYNGSIALAAPGVLDFSAASMPDSFVYNFTTISDATLIFYGSEGDDQLIMPADAGAMVAANGRGGDDVLVGGADGDVLDGGQGNDRLTGRDGGDYLIWDGGSDTLDAGAGADTIQMWGDDSVAAVLTIDGGSGDDFLRVGEASMAAGSSLAGVETIFVGAGHGSGSGQFGSGVLSYVPGLLPTTGALFVHSATLMHLSPGETDLTGMLMPTQFEEPRGYSYSGATLTFIGSDGADVFRMPAASGVRLTAQGGGGGDTIIGAQAADVLSGGADDDTIVGAEGDDTVNGGAGGDSLNGGAGADTISFEGSSVGVSVRLDTGMATGGDAQGDSFTSFENILGSAYSDILIGSAGVNLLMAGPGGADILEGLGGADQLFGHLNAAASYASSNAAVNVNLTTGIGTGGHAEGDQYNSIHGLIGSAFGDTLIGDDIFYAGNTLDGGAGNDTLRGMNGFDVLIGGAGADTLDGGSGIDAVSYVGSNTAVTVMLATNVVSGGHARGDTIINFENATGSDFNDSLHGTNGANELRGGAGVDTLAAFAGDDVLIGGAGADAMNGGADQDIAEYFGSAGGVNVSLSTGQCVGGDAQGDTLTAIENLRGTVQGDTLEGSDGIANTLYGEAGDDVLRGLGGDDVLLGGIGADAMDGGGGADTVSYIDFDGAMSINFTTGLGAGAAQGDTYANIENAIGGYVGDSLTGNGSVNRLEGGNGDDSLVGLAGDDVLMGGLSADFLDGGAGADMLDGGDGHDTTTYAASNAGVILDLLGGPGAGGDAAGDVLIGIETIYGSAFADDVRGLDVADYFYGGAGSDALYGRDGSDWLAGGAGGDHLDGGAGLDIADYTASAAIAINLATGAASGGDAAGDTFVSIEEIIGTSFADTLHGSSGVDNFVGGAGDDVLVGSAGDDALFGDAGDDFLVGGQGVDLMVGGDGVDTADYSAAIAGTAIQTASASFDGEVYNEFAWVENVIGSAFDDTMYGDSGDNRLEGGAGDDILSGGEGNDVLLGGVGDDSYYVSYYETIATDVLNGGHDKVFSQVSFTLAANIEDLQLTSDFAVFGTGNALDNHIVGYGESVLSGADGADTLETGVYDDTLIGGAGADIMNGYLGDDTYEVDNAGDVVVELDQLNGGFDVVRTSVTYTLSEGVENLVLLGAAAINGVGNTLDNSITGNAASNLLRGGAGADVLEGGSGADAADYSTSAARVRVNLATGVAIEGDAQGDTFISIENLGGSAFNDVLTGSALANALSGAAGRDNLQGLGGNDILIGASGNDVLDGGDGVDVADYASSAARVRVSLATGGGLDADAQGDTLANIENLAGSAFDDVLTGNAGVNALLGAGGADALIGGAGADALNGGDGLDTADYAASAARVRVNLTSGLGADADAQGDSFVSIENLNGSAFNDVLTGGAPANALSGAAGRDTLQGLGGDDLLIGGAESDALDGGDGVDVADYTASSARVRVDLTTGLGFEGDAHGDTLASIERITGSAFNDILTGNAGVNMLTGATGADVLTGGAGADALNGGDGIDLADYAASGVGVRVNLTTGAGLGGDAQGDTLSGVENLIGSAFNDVLTGNASANTLNGGAARDNLQGLGGDDLLIGAAGNDVLDGGDGVDVADYAGSSARVRVNLATGAGLDADAQGDTLANIENLIGSAFNDQLTGNADANVLAGRAGADALDGGDGADTADYSGSAARVRVTLSTGAALDADATGDTFISIENLSGSAFNDILTGAADANVLIGGGGHDQLSGLGGADVLTGGAGLDAFVFAAALGAGNIDTVTDFSVVNDTIWIDNAVFWGLASGALAASAFSIGAAAADASDRIIYNAATGALMFDADGAGAGAAVQFASLAAGVALTNADFLVV
jgi:Ca2+-binding RTX toxin-like protein